MALVTGTRFDDVMSPTVGQFTRPDGTVVDRPENKTTAQADTVFGRAGDGSMDCGGGNVTIVEGSGHDFIDGGLGDDSRDVGAGNAPPDAINVRDDRMIGDAYSYDAAYGSGDDVMNGGSGRDDMFGDA